MSNKSILFIIGRCPYPLDTGAKIRTWNILTGLSTSYAVDVLYLSDGNEDPTWIDTAKKQGVREVYALPNTSINKPVSIAQALKAILTGLPLSSIKYQSKLLEKKLDELLDGYDMVHIETIHLASLLDHVAKSDRKIITALNAHNIEYVIAERMCVLEKSPFKKLALSLHAKNMRQFEMKAFAASDVVYAVSPKDVKDIDAMAGVDGRALLVNNGVDLSYFSPGTEDVNDNDLVFVGSMDWAPNVDGVIWFVKNIYPSIKEKRPETRLFIVGRSPKAPIVELGHKDSSIIVTGTVDDVRPYVRQCALVIVPLRYGGGTRLKILEAFSMKKAMVSTTVGCEGIVCTDGKEILIKDSLEEFFQACVDLMESRDKRESLGNAGYGLVVENYSWSKIIQQIKTAIDSFF